MRSSFGSLLIIPLVIATSFAPAQSGPPSVRIIHATICDTIITIERLRQLPAHSAEIKGHDGQSATYTGALLMDVIGAGCPAVPAAEKRERIGMAVRVDAQDGYHAIIALMEADTSFREHPVLLTWARNGKALDAHDGPLQLIIPDDLRHARDVRGVKRLSIVAP